MSFSGYQAQWVSVFRRNVKSNPLIFTLTLIVLAKILISFLLGFHPFFASFIPIGILLWLVGFLLAGICLIFSLRKAIRRQTFMRFTGVWLSLAFLNLMPGIFASATGSMIALYLAGPEQVVAEGRELIRNAQLAEAGNCEIAYPGCGQIMEHPPAITRVHPVYVRVTDEYVLIKKFGIGDVAGFKIYPEGINPPGIRLRDGLYWIDAW